MRYRLASRLLCGFIVLGSSAAIVNAGREPLRSFRPVRFLTEARADDAWHVGPRRPTRDEQLRPLPSFAEPPGFLYVHNSIWNRIRNYDWAVEQQQIADEQAAQAADVAARLSGPRTILLIDNRSHAATQPTQPTSRPSGPVIQSITIR